MVCPRQWHRCLGDGLDHRIPVGTHRKPFAVVVVDDHLLDLPSRGADACEIHARQLETNADGLNREFKSTADRSPSRWCDTVFLRDR